MKLLRKMLDAAAKPFHKGQPLERLHPLYEAIDTFHFSPGTVTGAAAHVRDALDLKRMMGIVVLALVPCTLMAMYNTGYQANRVMELAGQTPEGWRAAVVAWLGLGFSPGSVLACFVHGAMYFIPVLVVAFMVGGNIEVIFSIVRKHEVNEGYLVTGFLIPLIVPPTIPLWQVAVATAFAVVFAKEVFGGTGMNFLNIALTARVFLFFAYPAQISGDFVWVAVNLPADVWAQVQAGADGVLGGPDAYSGATMLAKAKVDGVLGLQQSGWSWWEAFLGLIPGSMGETSALCCLIGAVILIVAQVGSWRVMLGVLIGSVAMALFFNAVSGHVENKFFAVPWYWHLVLGGWAFGTVFMATDPVTSAFTEVGKFIYGLCIGLLAIMIRVVNPAYPEGMMLAILFMNIFAPTIDYFVVKQNIKRRVARYATV